MSVNDPENKDKQDIINNVETISLDENCEDPDRACFEDRSMILVADDEEDIRRIIGEMLQLCDCEVVSASNGIEALEQYYKYAHQLEYIILDLTMPRLAGEFVLEEVRTSNQDIPIIIISGYGERETARRMADRGPYTFLQKPFRLSELKEKLSQAHSPKLKV